MMMMLGLRCVLERAREPPRKKSINLFCCRSGPNFGQNLVQKVLHSCETSLGQKMPQGLSVAISREFKETQLETQLLSLGICSG